MTTPEAFFVTPGAIPYAAAWKHSSTSRGAMSVTMSAGFAWQVSPAASLATTLAPSTSAHATTR